MKILNTLFKLSVLAFMTCVLSAAAPQEDTDLIELQGWFNARSTDSYYSTDNNKVVVLQTGTKAKVLQSHELTDKNGHKTGNYGLCIQLVNIENPPSLKKDECLWVHYKNNESSGIKLYHFASAQKAATQASDWSKDPKIKDFGVNDPTKATDAQTTRQVSSVVQKQDQPEPEHRHSRAHPKPPEKDATDKVGAVDQTRDNAEVTNTIGSSAAEKIDHLNNNPPGILATAGGQPCSDCRVPPKYASSQKCSTKNDYLETALDGVMQDPIMSTTPETTYIKDECVQQSLRVLGSGFGKCDNGKVVHTSAPCYSDKYKTVAEKSFDIAMSCLMDFYTGNQNYKNQNKIAALYLFRLFNMESGVNINAYSPNNAKGPGQLTDKAIMDVDRLELKPMQAKLAKSKNPSCQELAKKIAAPTKSANSCDIFRLKGGNPFKNMAYAIAYQRMAREQIEADIFTTNKKHPDNLYKNIFQKLPEDQKERLLDELATWANNTGPGGMMTPLNHLLVTQYLNKNVTTAKDVDDLLAQLATTMVTHPNQHNSSDARKKETSRFHNDIERKFNPIEQSAGGHTCLAQ